MYQTVIFLFGDSIGTLLQLSVHFLTFCDFKINCFQFFDVFHMILDLFFCVCTFLLYPLGVIHKECDLGMTTEVGTYKTRL